MISTLIFTFCETIQDILELKYTVKILKWFSFLFVFTLHLVCYTSVQQFKKKLTFLPPFFSNSNKIYNFKTYYITYQNFSMF